MSAELKKLFAIGIGILGGFLLIQYLSGIVTLVNVFWPVAWSPILKACVVFVSSFLRSFFLWILK